MDQVEQSSFHSLRGVPRGSQSTLSPPNSTDIKNFTFLVASTFAATSALISSTADAGFVQVSTFIARYQDASGLTNIWAGGSVSAGYTTGGTVTNASGTAWQINNTYAGGSSTSAMSLGSPATILSESEVDSTIGGWGNGTWSADLGNGAFQFNTSPVYKTGAQRNYLSLTAASVALWNNIVATSAVGSFTFELTQSLSSLGFTSGNAVTNIGQTGSFDLNSTTFTVNFTQINNTPLPAFLYLAANEATTEIYSANGDTVTYQNSSGTVIGGAVPAPGAIALLGLAGLAGRRRR
ncbi:MAG: hypothetical protein QM516_00245 [Limnohabitans sp.]|nr:hypothetical protein [Limnohabitans sp.]